MGTFDVGILDNDAAMDGLGDLRHSISEEIARLGSTKPGPKSTPRLAAAVGLLLQLDAYSFSAENDRSGSIVEAVKAHLAWTGLSPKARAVLERVANGEGEALAERPAKLPAGVGKALRSAFKGANFGKREPALFDSKPGAAYVQEIARGCVETIDEDFEDEDLWSDLCREAMGMGGLAALLVLEPCSVPARKIERWRKCAQKGLAALEEREDEELDFQRPYHANLDRVYAALLKRFS